MSVSKVYSFFLAPVMIVSLFISNLFIGQQVFAGVCVDLLKSECEKKRNCNWVKGYVNENGVRINGYCRKLTVQSKSATQKKVPAKKQASVCSDLLKKSCEKKSKCNWVKGYRNSKGERVKGYCRKKATRTKTPSSVTCTGLLKVDCGSMHGCSWVKGYTNSKGEKVKGYCRKVANSGKAKKKKNQQSSAENKVIDLIEEILSPK